MFQLVSGYCVVTLIFSHNLFIVPLVCLPFGSPFSFHPPTLSASLHAISSSASCCIVFRGGSARSWCYYISPSQSTMTETYIWTRLPGEEALKFTHVGRHSGCYQVERSVSAYTLRRPGDVCVSGPGFEAAGLLYCSRWCTFSIYKKTLSVGSKEEVLSSIPASNTADLNHFVAARMVTLYWCTWNWLSFLYW